MLSGKQRSESTEVSYFKKIYAAAIAKDRKFLGVASTETSLNVCEAGTNIVTQLILDGQTNALNFLVEFLKKKYFIPEFSMACAYARIENVTEVNKLLGNIEEISENKLECLYGAIKGY